MRLSQSVRPGSKWLLLVLTLLTGGACASSNPSPAPPGASSASSPTDAAPPAHTRADGCPEGYGGLVGQPCDPSMEGKICGPEHPETMTGFVPMSICTQRKWGMLEAPPPPGRRTPPTLTRAHDAPSPEGDAAAPAPSASVPDGAPPNPALVFACAADSDCTAVPENMCCTNGTLEAVNAQQVDAYRKSWRQMCPPAACPTLRKQDTRVAECGSSHKCEMVAIEKMVCGAGKSQHACPSGYDCKPAAHGKCVR
jgi:hypothetical protein